MTTSSITYQLCLNIFLQGYIRFASDAEVPLSKMRNDDGKIMLKDTEVTAEILTGMNGNLISHSAWQGLTRLTFSGDAEVEYQKRISEFAGNKNRGGGQNRGE